MWTLIFFFFFLKKEQRKIDPCASINSPHTRQLVNQKTISITWNIGQIKHSIKWYVTFLQLWENKKKNLRRTQQCYFYQRYDKDLTSHFFFSCSLHGLLSVCTSSSIKTTLTVIIRPQDYHSYMPLRNGCRCGWGGMCRFYYFSLCYP